MDNIFLQLMIDERFSYGLMIIKVKMRMMFVWMMFTKISQCNDDNF